MAMSVTQRGAFAAVFLVTLASCSTAPRRDDVAARLGDEISVCGRLYHTGTAVVLWNDPGGYNAYSAHRHFEPEEIAPSLAPDHIARFGARQVESASLAEQVRSHGWRVELLREVVSQVVIHFDACGTSRRCFEVLHDIRGLSCHFLLDLDGTVYQTLDLKERAWHASHANDRSIGIEIAHIGCFPAGDDAVLSKWYRPTADGVRVTIPEAMGDTGLAPGFVPRCSRPQLFKGTINGREYAQHDFTEEQYRALERLLTALCRVFPNIEPEVPRDPSGAILTTTLGTEEEMIQHRGLIAHFHLSRNKVDPGPAFDWKRIIDHLRREVGGPKR